MGEDGREKPAGEMESHNADARLRQIFREGPKRTYRQQSKTFSSRRTPGAKEAHH